MQIGFAVPVAGSWATPANQVRVAQRAEELGYSGLWTFQRLIYPVKPESDRWAPVYKSVVDPLITLAFLAGLTQRIRLGVAIVNAPYFSPLLLAKQFTTLDLVSNGRLDAGIGLGWAPDEFAAAGAPYEKRGKRMEDFLKALDAILTTDPVNYHGEFYEIANAHVLPKAVQKPRPPFLLGGSSEPALRRAGRLADGWVSASRADLSALAPSIELVRSGAREAGRDPDKLRFITRGVVKVRAQREGLLSGSYDDIRQDLADIAAQGVTEVFIDLNFDPEIGAVDADPVTSMRRAEEALEVFAPG
jgi:probable F420-dependent oxidoreductase